MTKVRSARPRLRAHALGLPGAWEDHPWDENVAKVGKKVFVFFGRPSGDLFVGVKLPRSLLYARSRPFVHAFGYGMDQHGWVAARFGKDDDVPVDLICEWIDESYAAVAPRRPGRSARPTVTASTRRPKVSGFKK